jgi:hypothetical protein
MTALQHFFPPEVSFLPIFDAHYFPLLGNRRDGFRRIFELLEDKLQKTYLIVETGCARAGGNWKGDGQSTLMWDHFVRTHSGSVVTVDRDLAACKMCNELVSSQTRICCMDSIQFLWDFNPRQPIDLLYQDSFDLDMKNPHPAALHHLKELCAAMHNLRKGTIIAIDDNLPSGPGKGNYVAQFMDNLGLAPVLEGLQMAWII